MSSDQSVKSKTMSSDQSVKSKTMSCDQSVKSKTMSSHQSVENNTLSSVESAESNTLSSHQSAKSKTSYTQAVESLSSCSIVAQSCDPLSSAQSGDPFSSGESVELIQQKKVTETANRTKASGHQIKKRKMQQELIQAAKTSKTVDMFFSSKKEVMHIDATSDTGIQEANQTLVQIECTDTLIKDSEISNTQQYEGVVDDTEMCHSNVPMNEMPTQDNNDMNPLSSSNDSNQIHTIPYHPEEERFTKQTVASGSKKLVKSKIMSSHQSVESKTSSTQAVESLSSYQVVAQSCDPLSSAQSGDPFSSGESVELSNTQQYEGVVDDTEMCHSNVPMNEMTTQDNNDMNPLSSSNDSNQIHTIPYHPEVERFTKQTVTSGSKKKKVLTFQSSWYTKYSWLHCSANIQGVVCFYCQYASSKNMCSVDCHEESTFTTGGFHNWKKALEKFSDHEKTRYHICATNFYQMQTQPTVQMKLVAFKCEQQQLARRMLYHIITSLRYLARQGLAIRGHDDNSGNFMQLLKLRSADLPELETWMFKQKNYTSPEIQNELLELMAHSVLRQLVTEIKKSSAYSIIVDGTQDCTHTEQESICVRYLNDLLQPQESFLGLYSTDCTTGEALGRLILDALLRLDIPVSTLRGQSYDGAANMAGVRNGAQAYIKSQQPNAEFVHCGSHCTNLVAQSACEASVAFRDALSLVNELGVLVHQSGKAKNALRAVVDFKSGTSIESIRPLCPTRWTVRAGAIKSVLNNLNDINDALSSISQWGGEVGCRANGLLSKLSAGSTVVALVMCLNVFVLLEELCVSIQSRSQTVSGMRMAVDHVLNELQRSRTDESFSATYAKASDMVVKCDLEEIVAPRTRCKPRRIDTGSAQYVPATAEEYFRAQYYEVVDRAIQRLNELFHQPGIDVCISNESSLLLPNSDLSHLSRYPELNVDRLRVQLNMFQMQFQFSSVAEAANIVREMKTEVRLLFSQVEILIKLVLVVPASSAEAERSFSTVRRLKTWLRSTVGQSRLNHLCLLAVHQEMLDSINIEAIANAFVAKNDSRKHVFGSF